MNYTKIAGIVGCLVLWGKLIVGLVGRGMVGGFVVVSLGVTVVLNISDVTGVAIDVVVDHLLATIGENNVVVSGGLVTVAGLVLAHVNVGVVVLDGPVVFVVGGGLVGHHLSSFIRFLQLTI